MDDYEVIVKGLDPVRVVTASRRRRRPVRDRRRAGRALPTPARRARRVTASSSASRRTRSTRTPTTNSSRSGSPPRCLVPDGVTIADDGVDTVDLPAVRARRDDGGARRARERFHEAFQALHAWAERTGEQTTGLEREVYLDCDGPRDTWVTELQAILAPKT